MSLEKLKSVFTEGFIGSVERSPIKDLKSEHMIGGDLGNGEVDHFGGNNSYKIPIVPAISGFTKNFNTGGYSYGIGDVGNSKYLDISSDVQTRTIDIDLTNLTTNRLGVGEYSSESAVGNFTNDTRFTAGYGWPFANTILQVSNQGNQASLFYTKTDGKISVGASGAISNFGPISDIANSIGVEIPPLDFSADIIGSNPLKYSETIWEKSNFTPTDTGEDLPPGYLGNQRGIAFQTISPNVNYGKVVEGSKPALGPISTIQDLYEGPNSGNAGRLETASSLISQMNTGRHYYLGNETSFVKLGSIVYDSILDAFMAGDIGYIEGKAKDFINDKVDIIADKASDMAQGAVNNIKDYASGIEITTEAPTIDVVGFVGDKLKSLKSPFSIETPFSFGSLSGPLTDFPSTKALGGFLKGIPLPNLSLPFDTPDINLPDINLPSLPSIGGGFGKGFGGFGSFTPSFPELDIKPNPELLTLINDIKDGGTATLNTIQNLLPKVSIGKSDIVGDTSALRQQIINDIQISSPYSNPRGLPPNTDDIEADVQLPYKELGTERYTDSGNTPISEGKTPSNFPNDDDSGNSNLSKLQQGKHVNYHGRADTAKKRGDTGNSGTSEIKYSDAIISKHPTADEEDGFQDEKIQGDFYPSTFGNGPDLKTLLPPDTGKSLTDAGKDYGSSTYVQATEGEKYGLPFYFKDLRDNKYIIFRGYLSGMTQEVSPDWTEHSYLGRSESVYVYGKAKRTINFTFKVMATSKVEVSAIYEKLNYLTSLAYPRYHSDDAFKNRMMPPLCSLRIGELFGNDTKNLQGFLSGLSFNWPDGSSWETETGKRVPRECDVTVGYTVIHREPPGHATLQDEFFGTVFK